MEYNMCLGDSVFANRKFAVYTDKKVLTMMTVTSVWSLDHDISMRNIYIKQVCQI